MSIVTLTSDMGIEDQYVALVKAALLAQDASVQIVDISHQVHPFDTRHAAYLLRHTYPAFPKGTIHLIGVNPDWQLDRPHVVVKADGQYFISADNGIYGLMLRNEVEEIYQIKPSEKSVGTFTMLDVFVPAALQLLKGESLEDIALKAESLLQNSRFLPVLEPQVIKGMVMHVDHYGNIITNIQKATFEEVGQGRSFQIIMRTKRQIITEISPTYGDVKHGQKVAVFGTSGFLEIAINKGAPGTGEGASALFGMQPDDIVRIEFA